MRERTYNKLLVLLAVVCTLMILFTNLYMLSLVGVFDTLDSSTKTDTTVLPLTEYIDSGSVVPINLVSLTSDSSAGDFICSPVGQEIEYKFGDSSVVVKVYIDESTVGCKPGRKNVYARFRYSSRGDADYISCTAFDRYTGTSFSSSPFSIEDMTQFECNGLPLGVVTSRTGEIRFAGQYEQEVVVNCYENYNGTVFQISPIFGDADKSMTSSKLHKIDEFSSWGNQLYFEFNNYLDLPVISIGQSGKN